jgi:predicted regulator of Ras-like GTPase activity (Roadblock/LC7/MglB family)
MIAVEPLSLALSSLRDIEGTQGSFVVSTNGELLAVDTPSTLSEGTLLALARRVPSLYGGLNAESDGHLESCAVRFTDRKLYVRSFAQGFLCVLTGADCAPPLFGMALSVVARRLSYTLDHQRAPL